MRATWEADPNQRPSYAKIKRKLSKGLQRLSALIEANKEQQEQEQPSRSTSSSPSHESAPSFTPAVVPDILEGGDPGIYTNLPRRTMNYYKNY